MWFHNIDAVSFNIKCGCPEGKHSLGEIMHNHVVLWWQPRNSSSSWCRASTSPVANEDWKKRVSKKTKSLLMCISSGIARAHIGAVQLEDILFPLSCIFHCEGFPKRGLSPSALLNPDGSIWLEVCVIRSFLQGGGPCPPSVMTTSDVQSAFLSQGIRWATDRTNNSWYLHNF